MTHHSTTALQLRTGATGGSYSVSIPSAVIGVRSAVGFVASRERPMWARIVGELVSACRRTSGMLTSIVDYSVGWNLETNSFHQHVRLV